MTRVTVPITARSTGDPEEIQERIHVTMFVQKSVAQGFVHGHIHSMYSLVVVKAVQFGPRHIARQCL